MQDGADVQRAVLALPEARRRAVLRAYDSEGTTLLGHCIDGAAQLDFAEAILRAGASSTAFQPGIRSSMQPLALAVETESQAMVRLLLASGAAENVTPLRPGPLAIAAGHRRGSALPLIQLLLAANLDVNHQCNDWNVGCTALARAAEVGNAQVVELLLAAGADPQLADSGEETPLSCALGGRHVDCAELILGRLCALRALPAFGSVVQLAAAQSFSGHGAHPQRFDMDALERFVGASLLFASLENVEDSLDYVLSCVTPFRTRTAERRALVACSRSSVPHPSLSPQPFPHMQAWGARSAPPP